LEYPKRRGQGIQVEPLHADNHRLQATFQTGDDPVPHLVLTYTPNIDTDLDVLCRTLCETLVAIRDDDGKAVYPPGGTRVLAYPAAHYAVADGKQDYRFLYMNLRIFGGRPASITKNTGEKLLAAAKLLLQPVIAAGPIGITIQIDETPTTWPGPLVMSHEDRHNTLHALFRK
jgi:5-carboxymethyl-2-hydroxymuconate isomerase